MKKIILMLAVVLTLAACAEALIPAQAAPETGSVMSDAVVDTTPAEDAGPASRQSVRELTGGNGKAVPAPVMQGDAKADADTAEDNADQAQPTDSQPDKQTQDTLETQPVAPESTPAPEAAPRPTAAPAPAANGTIPFELAAGTGTWWTIDASDSAYWAVQENINAMRAAGGLPALSMDDSLSSIASARCESFVMGGPFDHSGMVTRSEICAAGPLGSASDVCSAWQNSETHYANIMRSDISSMGVGCWFCEIEGNRYTYWTVTFE